MSNGSTSRKDEPLATLRFLAAALRANGSMTGGITKSEAAKRLDELIFTLSEKASAPEVSAGGALELKLYGTPGILGTSARTTFHVDPNVPEGTVIVRDELGRELGRIINVGR